MEPTKPYSPCDYVNTARDNHPKPLTREYFATLLEDINVRLLCEKIREHNPHSEVYKTALPAITWQSRFFGKVRSDLNAIPTGLFCLDVDIHHEEGFKNVLKLEGVQSAMRWAEQEAHLRAERWAAMQVEQDRTGCSPADDLAILGIHISPSGTGVHVIACCNEFCKSIEENQARLARLLGTSYDAVCKDWARIFFMTPKEDWTYLDINSLFQE